MNVNKIALGLTTALMAIAGLPCARADDGPALRSVIVDATITAGALRLPWATHAPMAPLVTPLQLQTCASAGISSKVIF